MNQKLISQLLAGLITIENTDNEKFIKVLQYVGYYRSADFIKDLKYFTLNTVLGGNKEDKPKVSVKDFFIDEVEFKHGDTVFHGNDKYTYACVDPIDNLYSIVITQDSIISVYTNELKKKSVFKGTLQQIAEKLGVDEVIVEE